jgi:hypothetical protein
LQVDLQVNADLQAHTGEGHLQATSRHSTAEGTPNPRKGDNAATGAAKQVKAATSKKPKAYETANSCTTIKDVSIQRTNTP